MGSPQWLHYATSYTLITRQLTVDHEKRDKTVKKCTLFYKFYSTHDIIFFLSTKAKFSVSGKKVTFRYQHAHWQK